MMLERIVAALLDELGPGHDAAGMARIALRLVVAVALGAVLGYDRERKDSAAGLRTYMLVALGASLFVVAPAWSGLSPDELGRVMQGVIAGIGFLGAGAIIKVSEREQVKGLTTAAGIWATAAIAVAAGLGRVWTAVFATALAYVVLAAMGRASARAALGTPDDRGPR